MKIAVVGATGMVGEVMLEVLEERGFPVTELLPVASEKSVGKKVRFKDQDYEVISIEDAIKQKPALAIFSAGGETSLRWAPEFAKAGTRVIDNSSAWRMDTEKKLIVPEINANQLSQDDFIIANPNCSTIQLALTFFPLHKKYRIKRAVISTYQSVTGTGVKAIAQMEAERRGEKHEMAYPYAIDKNCLPHCDDFLDNGYTKEEMKLSNETVKIFGDETIQVTATAVRVPVVGGHSESVNITFENDFELEDVRKALRETEGIILQDNPSVNVYPMPIIAQGKNEVYVGRIRRDFSMPNSLNLWIVSDNLRKGAATNAIQIAEYLLQQGWIK